MKMLLRIYPYDIRTWIDRLALVNKPPDRNCLIFYDNIAFKCHMFHFNSADRCLPLAITINSIVLFLPRNRYLVASMIFHC